MRSVRATYVAAPWILLLGLLAGCDDGGTTAPPGGGGYGGGLGGQTGDGGLLFTGGTGGSGGGADPCADLGCPADQHCEVGSDGPECVNNTCADLSCSATEECEETSGGGAICVDISCSEDVECPPERYCDGTICVDDICEPGFRSCGGPGGLELRECTPNGGSEPLRWTCTSDAYFISQCVDDGQGNAFCSCEDDWDCPPYSVCEAGQCTGSGVAPTCFLPPEPFDQVLPTPEIVWGGDPPYPGATTYASGSPFEQAAQVVQTPVVANLDDDNQDGEINELDFPEIVFTAFRDHEFTTNGVLRAIHGGGPNKGADFFANCGGVEWHEGDSLPATCTYGNADLDSTSSLAVGDLDNDGVPEIVAVNEGGTTDSRIRIYSNTGSIIATSATFGSVGGANPAPAIANLDFAGFAEIVVGRNVFTLEHDTSGQLVFLDHFAGTGNHGTNGQGPASCVANVLGNLRPEIIAGATVYGFPQPPAGATSQADCATFPPSNAEETAFCNGQLTTEWTANLEGFCAIADVLGADQTAAPGPNNPLDDLPEVVLITNGTIRIYNGQDGTERRNISLNAGTRGGPPNVDDFDGDGFPEVGTAASTAYVVFDFQDPGASCPTWTSVTHDNGNLPRTPPATTCNQDSDCGDLAQFACNEATNSCVCLHNNWRRATEDDSSQVTGSSVFDFNGDGAAEVVYNDECRFRIYDGLDGEVLFDPPSESRTRIEYPIVADVDNDGNAEIVFSTTNESGFCSQNLDSSYNNGIEVWGDAGDYWVSARRIWNQHAYNVTNVTEGGAVPLHAPESWREYHGRRYNIFRSNPRSQGIAPDLTVKAVQVSSPDAVCGQLSDLLDITVEIENRGDLRVGPGVVVGFHGDWTTVPLQEPLYADAAQTPVQYVLQNTLEPGASIFFTVSYDSQYNSPGVLPDTITVIVDETDLERECDELNNELTKDVVAGQPMADLRIALGTPLTNPCPTVPTTIFNDGSAPASNITVRYYAGDPNQGGTALHDAFVTGPIVAGGQHSFDETIPNFPQGVIIRIWGVVDPDNVIEECNDGNNRDSADDTVQCGGIN
ncbi:MAG: hypothetical protein JRI23_06070 [Deltaproteobacteria bacterium]|jgi:hypothetical protein|nr:hypothetical protein [Deltaproteobacteria bacterium]MBW2531134.1 hypothetical protein [Deltaproteobacteria bacterium]